MLFSSISPAITIFKKDLRSELRTRYSLNSLLMFVITTLSIILFAIGNENVSTDVLSGVLWIIIFFSTMSGLSRTFVTEEERGTVMTLQLVARPLTIYFGKLLFNLILLCALNLFTITLYLLLLQIFRSTIMKFLYRRWYSEHWDLPAPRQSWRR